MTESRSGLVDAINGLDANRDRAVVQRTRRKVYIAAMAQHEGRSIRRRHAGMAILIAAALFLLLTPALWSGVDDILGGELLTDLPGLVAGFVLMLFAGVFAVLFLLSSFRQQVRR